MEKKLALDIHGIINTHPEFFAAATQSFVKTGWEVHVLTGSHIEEMQIKEELSKLGISYTHLFSIADFHRENKTEGMWYDEKGDPWVSDENWDRTKAKYCKDKNIMFCIDDTARYANYFETPFGYMSIQMHKEKPNKYLNLIIDMFKKRSEKALSDKNNWMSWFDKKFGWIFCPPNKLGKEERNKIYK